MTTHTSGAADLPEALRVPLDSLHADAGYLCGRLLNGSLTQEQVVESIRRRIDAAKLAALTAQAISKAPDHVAELETLPVGYINRGIAPHTKGKTVFHEKPTTNLEERWWSRDEPVFLASHGQAPAVKREFTNELGNSIRITVEGPNSMHENIVTPMEAKQLREALNEHAQKSAPAGAAEADLPDTLLRRLDSGELAAWVDCGMSLAENLAMYVQADCTLRESQARDMLRAHLFSAQPSPHAQPDAGVLEDAARAAQKEKPHDL